MPREPRNPLPEFMTSPSLARMIAVQLDERADSLSKNMANSPAGEQSCEAHDTLIAALHDAADQLRSFHLRGALR